MGTELGTETLTLGLRLKSGVRLGGVRPEVVVALVITSTIFSESGDDLVVTSLSDGVHSTRSLHYSGAAFDCRIRHVQDVEGRWEDLTRRIQVALGTDFQVILERKNAHIHVEYQPLR
jgi:hypothetical protein